MNRWPKHNPYFWETSPFFRLLLPLMAGILLYGQLPDLSFSFVAVGAVGLVALTGLSVRYKSAYKAYLFPAAMLVLLSTGYILSFLGDIANAPAWYGKRVAVSAANKAIICSEPKVGERTWKIEVEVIAAYIGGSAHATRGKAFVYGYLDDVPPIYHKGDTILLKGHWLPVGNAGNPFEFDYATFCRRNGVYYQQFCGRNDIRLLAACDKSKLSWIDKAHDYCTQSIERNIPDKRAKGLIQAMLLGDEENLDPQLRQSFTDTGIIHVIAISGSNIMMFFAVIGFMLGWIKHRKYFWVRYVIAFPLVWLYVVMAGASPSAVRAAVTFSILALGFIFNKSNNATAQLAAAAFILLCIQPSWLYAIGFQLSFIAVWSIVLFYGPIHGLYRPAVKYKPVRWLVNKIWETLSASLAAEILVAPIVVFYFHNFPVTFLIANVLSFFFMFAVLVLGIMVVATAMVPVVAAAIGMVDVQIVDGFYVCIQWLQSLEPEALHFLQIGYLQAALIYLSVLGAAYYVLYKYKQGIFIVLVSMAILLVSLSIDKYHSLGQQRLVVYNVSHGTHIERIQGGYYSVLRTDTALKHIAYATTPAHTGWHAWRAQPAPTGNTFVISGHKICILDGPRAVHNEPADYVIVNYAGKPMVNEIMRAFHPQRIVVGNNNSRKQQEAWLKEAASMGVSVHAVGRHGAFVVE